MSTRESPSIPSRCLWEKGSDINLFYTTVGTKRQVEDWAWGRFSKLIRAGGSPKIRPLAVYLENRRYTVDFSEFPPSAKEMRHIRELKHINANFCQVYEAVALQS